MPIEEHGVTFAIVEGALMHIRAGFLPKSYNRASTTTYIMWEGELWDLKPVVAKAFELANSDMAEDSDWNTTKYRDDLVRIGFPVVVFREKRHRKLGISGFSADELDDDHCVLFPPDMRREDNVLRSFEDIDEGAPQRLAGISYFIRDPEIRRQCLKSAKGICQSCGKTAFKTRYDEWFLEVHHKKWLREGGADALENVIALCPNCHRQEHYGANRKYY
ncbi:HNH endonuclease [Paracoccus angustae]|uniref:HNH endonuclease n=1 Tax=Paracoccus angustae TaxID=1671480 RepID=A0ABV7U270_9RHOB